MNLHLYRCEACGIVRALEVLPLDRRCPEQTVRIDWRAEEPILSRCRGLLTTLTLGDFLTVTAGPAAALDTCDGQAGVPTTGSET